VGENGSKKSAVLTAFGLGGFARMVSRGARKALSWKSMADVKIKKGE